MLVLPTKQIPAELLCLIDQSVKAQTKMVNGFRNRIISVRSSHNQPSSSQSSSSSAELQLVLVKDAKYCGRAFCYQLLKQQLPSQQTNVPSQLEQQVNRISEQYRLKDQQQSKQDELYFVCSKLEKAGRNYVLVCEAVANNQNQNQKQVRRNNDIFKIDWKQQNISITHINKIIDMLGVQGQSCDVAKNIVLSMFDTYDALVQSGLAQFLMPNIKVDSTMPTIVTDGHTVGHQQGGQNMMRVPKCDLKSGEWSNKQTITLKLQPQKKITQSQPQPSSQTQAQPKQQQQQQQQQVSDKQARVSEVADSIMGSLASTDKKQVF